ncbi:hypothetical protein EQ826_17545 [Ectopseudomonas mendocina]|nr:hypothetical protein [Pseudomonas mendocina]TRO24305.1 hypothetical protein EQ826_17545 [Pseudomonas mendocina]TRO24526.1 hypothetical protein EQ828_06025 [Pseudomonas mendocina]
MGMDVLGQAPVSERGEYFRNNVWWWHPLWEYCEHLAPDLIPQSNLGHFNDGWGLDSQASRILADRLASALAAGEVEQYAQDYAGFLAALPDEPCTICSGTGKRAEPPHRGPGTWPCNSCESTGRRPHFATHYPFSAENVREFEAFLRDCGGFKIC